MPLTEGYYNYRENMSGEERWEGMVFSDCCSGLRRQPVRPGLMWPSLGVDLLCRSAHQATENDALGSIIRRRGLPFDLVALDATSLSSSSSAWIVLVASALALATDVPDRPVSSELVDPRLKSDLIIPSI